MAATKPPSRLRQPDFFRQVSSRSRRFRRFGLRTRLTLTFAIGALALSGALASITYYTTRHTIISQTVTSDEATAVSYSRTLEQEIPQQPLNTVGTATAFLSDLATIDRLANTISMIGYTSDIFFYDSSKLSSRDLPKSLRQLVLSGTPAEQVFRFGNENYLAVGIPIPLNSTTTVGYFEVFNLSQVGKTLQIVLASLTVAAIVTTLLGAVLGRWAARRTLAPLRHASRAALAIANGELDTRLEEDRESDLAVLSSSFNTMVDRLQFRLQRDAQFTSDVSHELRSPLTTLVASLGVLETRRDELPERSQQALDLLSSEIRRFQRMVRDLLEISRIDAGSGDFQPDTVRVGELIRAAMRSVSVVPVPVTFHGDIAKREIAVDKRRFERIMANLILNADRHAGGATDVEVSGVDDVLRIAVDDNGPGVPDNEKLRIFERFARGTATAGRRGKDSGSGLGLSLVYEHVKLHDGQVWVEDGPLSGARFIVELPLLPWRYVYETDEAVDDGDDISEVSASVHDPAGLDSAGTPPLRDESSTKPL